MQTGGLRRKHFKAQQGDLVIMQIDWNIITNKFISAQTEHQENNHLHIDKTEL